MEQRIVMVNLVQCWQCKQYIPPGDEIRVRTMRTAVEVGSGLNSGRLDRYEPVSLCLRCDQAAARAYEKEQERNALYARMLGWALGGIYMLGVFRAISLPWSVAIGGTIALARIGILGRCCLALAENVIAALLGVRGMRAQESLLVYGTLAVMVLATCGWRLVHRPWWRQKREAGQADQRKVPGTAAPSRRIRTDEGRLILTGRSSLASLARQALNTASGLLRAYCGWIERSLSGRS